MRKTLSGCEHLYATKMYRRGNGKIDLSNLINNLQYTDVKDYLIGENGGYPPTKNGDIRSLLCA